MQSGPIFALLTAIVLEVIGTSLLPKTEQFSRFWPTLGMAVAYLLAFYLLTHALKLFPLGIAYAIWSGLGMVLVATIGAVVFGQRIDLAGVIGLGLIIAGVIVVNLFSNSVSH